MPEENRKPGQPPHRQKPGAGGEMTYFTVELDPQKHQARRPQPIARSGSGAGNPAGSRGAAAGRGGAARPENRPPQAPRAARQAPPQGGEKRTSAPPHRAPRPETGARRSAAPRTAGEARRAQPAGQRATYTRHNSRPAAAAAAPRRWLVPALIAVALVVCAGLILPRLYRARSAEKAAAPAQAVPVATAGPTETGPAEETVQAVAAETTPAPTEEPALTPDPAAGENAQPKDAAGWNESGKALMASLKSQPAYAGMDLTVQPGYPYMIAVNRAASCVTVYTADENNEYTVPFQAMVCSGGSDTPLGYWSTPINYQWRLLSGPCYGQYATRIWDAYLFHSVPYYTQHKDDLEYDEYNKLGTLASLGCIRLMVVDVKWIYDNCAIGTPVVIYDDAEDPGPMGKPGIYYSDPADETLRGWDPTDPDPVNPWPELYRVGTTIRSEAARQLFEEATADGRWAASLTPTDLQGYSTDSSVEGTRG